MSAAGIRHGRLVTAGRAGTGLAAVTLWTLLGHGIEAVRGQIICFSPVSCCLCGGGTCFVP